MSVEPTQSEKKWRRSIAISEKGLKITEIWPSDNKSVWRTLKIVCIAIACTIMDITVLDELKTLLIKRDYNALSLHLANVGMYIGFSVKIILFQFKKNKPLTHMLNSMDAPIFHDYPPEMQKHQDRCIWVSNVIARSYTYLVAFTILLYNMKPLFSSYPLPVTFSHDLSTISFYLLLSLQCFCAYFFIMVGISFDLLFLGLVNVATTQLDMLVQEIVTFTPDHVEDLEEEEQRFIKKCVERHIAVIRYITSIEDVFTNIYLVQCVISVTCICNALFQLTHAAPIFSMHFYYNCFYNFNLLFEIGIGCWFATMMTAKSLEVADACYNFNWLNSSTATKKLLLIIICRSQKPLFVTVGKIIQLSIGSFLSVLKSAYSYYALMQTLYNEANN